MPSLASSMDDMVSIIERHRGPSHSTRQGERHMKECVTVQVWMEADGSETVTVIGDPDMTALQMKGILHDGVYAVAHADEDVFTA